MTATFDDKKVVYTLNRVTKRFGTRVVVMDKAGLARRGGISDFILGQARFAKAAAGSGQKEDKTRIVFNSTLTLEGIPLEAYPYVVNGRAAIEWVMERYQVRVDKDSGIKNDPNDWCVEVGDPRYIVDLVKRVTRVSIETMKIVDALPKWEPEGQPATVDANYDATVGGRGQWAAEKG